ARSTRRWADGAAARPASTGRGAVRRHERGREPARTHGSPREPSGAHGSPRERRRTRGNGEAKRGRTIMARLMDLARTIRSKNAGPDCITFDIIFSDDAVYRDRKSTR